MPTIQEQVSDILVAQLAVEPELIKPSSSLSVDLGADSIDVVEIIMEMEDRFDIVIPDDDAQRILTVEHVVDYITGRVAK